MALRGKLDDLRSQHIHIPKLPVYPGERVLNAAPEIVKQLKGRVVLVDFWDYSCVNCIRTLPHIKEWHSRYKDKDFLILGIHSPEFAFEKEHQNLDSAVRQFGLDPIIADNDFEIWQLFDNQYWPAKYLFDHEGVLRTSHFGEGGYAELEAFIQKLLLERDPSLKLPETMKPFRETDMPGAVCYRTTPETYIRFLRGSIGNPGGFVLHQAKEYELPNSLRNDVLYLEGVWRSEPEYAQLVKGKGSILMSYQAAEVNLVINPADDTAFKVYLEQDNSPLTVDGFGEDVDKEDGKAVVEVSTPRMYNLVRNNEFGRHLLRLTTHSPDFRAYAFTFVSECKPASKTEG